MVWKFSSKCNFERLNTYICYLNYILYNHTFISQQWYVTWWYRTVTRQHRISLNKRPSKVNQEALRVLLIEIIGTNNRIA